MYRLASEQVEPIYPYRVGVFISNLPNPFFLLEKIILDHFYDQSIATVDPSDGHLDRGILSS